MYFIVQYSFSDTTGCPVKDVLSKNILKWVSKVKKRAPLSDKNNSQDVSKTNKQMIIFCFQTKLCKCILLLICDKLCQKTKNIWAPTKKKSRIAALLATKKRKFIIRKLVRLVCILLCECAYVTSYWAVSSPLVNFWFRPQVLL